MLIVMDAAASAEDVHRVVETVRGLGLQAHPIPGAQRTAIGITGNRGAVEAAAFEGLPGVAEVIPVFRDPFDTETIERLGEVRAALDALPAKP